MDDHIERTTEKFLGLDGERRPGFGFPR